MHPNPKRIAPVIIVIALLSVGAYYGVSALTKSNGIIVSGAIEATEVRVGAQMGGRVDSVLVDEGDQVTTDQLLAELQMTAKASHERISSPIDGVVLYRSVEPGEVVAPGAPLVTVANLDDLTLTVYVPEDRYGQITLGAEYPVTVDSFANEVFTGTVSHIADKAEFTPRNVQTTDSRRTTVFAIRLDLSAASGKLKPGMPADVYFAEQ